MPAEKDYVNPGSVEPIPPSAEPARFYVASTMTDVVDANGRLLDLVNGLLAAFPESEDSLGLWEVVARDRDGPDCWGDPEVPPRLVGAIRPDGQGRPAVVWL